MRDLLNVCSALLLASALVACDDEKSGDSTPAPSDSSTATSGLDRPGDLPRPPTKGLPSDLRPPTQTAK